MSKTSYIKSSIKSVVGLLSASLLFIPSNGFASDIDADKIRGSSQVSPVSVLQNRHFVKVWRPEAGFMAGSMLNEAYTNTRAVGVRVGMFTSEWLGFEIQSLKTSVSDTDDREALNTLRYRPLEDPTDGSEIVVSPDPEVNPIKAINEINVIAAPFYGKLNLLNKYIIYSDLYISGGLSRVETVQGDHMAVSFGAGQRFYFSNDWSVRIDFKDRIFTEKRANQDSQKNAYSFDVGASYFFR